MYRHCVNFVDNLYYMGLYGLCRLFELSFSMAYVMAYVVVLCYLDESMFVLYYDVYL